MWTATGWSLNRAPGSPLGVGWSVNRLLVVILGIILGLTGCKEERVLKSGRGNDKAALFSLALDEKLVSSPFFLQDRIEDETAWYLGYATLSPDPEARGDVTAVNLRDGRGKTLAASPLKGFEVHAGYQLAAGNLTQSPGFELLVFDTENRLHIFSAKGEPIHRVDQNGEDLQVITSPPSVAVEGSPGRPVWFYGARRAGDAGISQVVAWGDAQKSHFFDLGPMEILSPILWMEVHGPAGILPVCFRSNGDLC